MENKKQAICFAILPNKTQKFIFHQNDSRTCKIEFVIYGTSLFDPLTDIKAASLTVKTPSGGTVTYGMSDITIQNNVVTFTLPTTALSISGSYSGELMIYGDSYERMTICKIRYIAIAEIVFDSPIQDDEHFPILTDLINTVNGMSEDMSADNSTYENSELLRNNAETSRVAAETSRVAAETKRETDYNSYKNVMIAESNVAALQSQINTNASDLADMSNMSKQLPSFYRTQIESTSKIHSSGMSYTAFGTGVNFCGKEIYAMRSANSHYTAAAQADWGKIIFYVRDEKGVFNTVIVPLDYLTADGEYRDPNLSLSSDGQYMFLSCASNNGSNIYAGYMWVFDKNLNIISPKIKIIDYNNVGNSFIWGNILQTPSGKLLKLSYRTTAPYGLDLYATTNPITTDFSSIVFEKINSVESDSYINETAMAYWMDKIVFITRDEGTTSKYFDTYDLEGTGYFRGMVSINCQLHSPVLPQYIDTNYAPLGGSLYISTILRQPAIMSIYKDISFSNPEVIDSEITSQSGYPSLVKNRYGYGMIYFEHNDINTNVWFKDINIERFLPSINSKGTNRFAFNTINSLESGGDIYTGVLFMPKEILKTVADAIDIIVRPNKDFTISGFCTYFKSNTGSTVSTGFQIMDASTAYPFTVVVDGDVKDVLATDRPKLYSYTCPATVLLKGHPYLLRVYGNVTAYCNTIKQEQRYFKIGESEALYEGVYVGGFKVAKTSTALCPVGLIINISQ